MQPKVFVSQPIPEAALDVLQQVTEVTVEAAASFVNFVTGRSAAAVWKSAAFDAMAKRAKAAQARFLGANPLFLKPCSKGTFLDFVQQNFPDLKVSY